MTMVTHSEGLMVQADGIPGAQALKSVAREYLAQIPAEAVFWVLLGAFVVGSIIGTVVTVKALKSVKRSIKTYTARMAAAIKDQATADQDRLSILDRMEQLQSQNWRGWYAKAHLGLCLLVSGVGIALAAEEHADMPFPLNLLAFVAFEGLAVAVMMRIEDRAKRALPYRGLIVLYWVAIGVAAGVQTTHISNPVGQVIWSAFTISGGLVYHLHMASVRSDKEARLRESEKRWVKRRMELVRWLRPLEAIQVVWEKAADADLGTDEATRVVRERTAERRRGRALDRVMWSVWRLRRAEQAPRVWGFGWVMDWVERNHLVLTQRAIAHASLHAEPARLEDLLRRLEAMDLAPRLSKIKSRSDARLIWGSYSSGSVQGPMGAAGSVGSMEQFALSAGSGGRFESGSEAQGSGSGRGVQVVFVAGSADSGSTDGFDSEEKRFEQQESNPVVEFDSGWAGFERQGSAAESGFESESSASDVKFEQQGSELDVEFESERGVWEHSTDGWIPPTVDQAWNRHDQEEWGHLFDPAPTPQRRILPPVVEAQDPAPEPDDNVRRVRTMDELRDQVRQAWHAGELTKLSSEQIYRLLGISKRRAAELREWLLREEMPRVLRENVVSEVSDVSLARHFGISRKQAQELLAWASTKGLVVLEGSEYTAL
ncbi:hypothetical protein [Nocardiopsis alba]|uniref:hypothetical protein n=1 Tax=Nocardiopsis alba TaxID=53437 RepID=UPI0033BBAFBE